MCSWHERYLTFQKLHTRLSRYSVSYCKNIWPGQENNGDISEVTGVKWALKTFQEELFFQTTNVPDDVKWFSPPTSDALISTGCFPAKADMQEKYLQKTEIFNIKSEKTQNRVHKLSNNLTSDNKTCKVGHPRATIWLGDTAVQILILIGDFFKAEGGSESSVVDVFGLSHGNVLTISPLKEREIDQMLERLGQRVHCLAQDHNLHIDLLTTVHTCSRSLLHWQQVWRSWLQ